MKIISREALIWQDPCHFFTLFFFPRKRWGYLSIYKGKQAKKWTWDLKTWLALILGQNWKTKSSFLQENSLFRRFWKGNCASVGVSAGNNLYADGWVEEILMKELFAFGACRLRWPTRRLRHPKLNNSTKSLLLLHIEGQKKETVTEAQ